MSDELKIAGLGHALEEVGIQEEQAPGGHRGEGYVPSLDVDKKHLKGS